jgi:hypothetical protein
MGMPRNDGKMWHEDGFRRSKVWGAGWHCSLRAVDCGCCGSAGCGERREGSPRRRPLPGIHFLAGRCLISPTRNLHQFCDLERETATQCIPGSKWNSGRPHTSLSGTSNTDLERETASHSIPGSKWFIFNGKVAPTSTDRAA